MSGSGEITNEKFLFLPSTANDNTGLESTERLNIIADENINIKSKEDLVSVSGEIAIETGNGTTGTGSISIVSGPTVSNSSGTINIGTGTGQTSGPITLETGVPSVGAQGNINLNAGSGSVVVTSSSVDIGGNVNLGDSNAINLGSSNDLVITHDGTDSTVTNNQGTLTVSNSGGDVNVTSSTGDVVLTSNTSTKIGSTDITGNLLVNGNLSTANAPNLYQRWEFGKIKLLWSTETNPTTMTPAATLVDDAVYLTTTNNRRVRLVSGVGDSGDIYWEIPSAIVNWEFRVLVYVSSSIISGITRMTGGATSFGSSDSVATYIGNVNIRIFNGGSVVTTDTTQTSEFFSGDYREFRLRKIGTEVTSIYNANNIGAGSTGGQRWTTSGTSTGTNGQGTVFSFNGQNTAGVGEMTVTYAELRSFD